jgi:hypothetical protein
MICSRHLVTVERNRCELLLKFRFFPICAQDIPQSPIDIPPAIVRVFPIGACFLSKEANVREYEFSYAADNYEVEQSSHSFTRQVRNLFGVSLVTDLIVDRHTKECLELSQEGSHGHCHCSPVPYYFLGHRAIPQEGVERLSVSPMFESLSGLEHYCEANTHSLRAKAKKKRAGG